MSTSMGAHGSSLAALIETEVLGAVMATGGSCGAGRAGMLSQLVAVQAGGAAETD